MERIKRIDPRAAALLPFKVLFAILGIPVLLATIGTLVLFLVYRVGFILLFHGETIEFRIFKADAVKESNAEFKADSRIDESP